MKDDLPPVPFLLAGGNLSWTPREPVLGLKYFERLDSSSKVRELLYPPTWTSHRTLGATGKGKRSFADIDED